MLSSHISVFHATGCFMWALVPKSSGIEYMVQYNQMETQFPYQKEKGGKKQGASSHVFHSSLLALCLQLLYISFLLLREAVAGANIIKYFSFRHKRHIPEDGL